MSFAPSLEQAEPSTVAWLVVAVAGIALLAICAIAMLIVAGAIVRRHRIAAVLLGIGALFELVASFAAPFVAMNLAHHTAAKFGAENAVLLFAGPTSAAVAILSFAAATASALTIVAVLSLLRPPR